MHCANTWPSFHPRVPYCKHCMDLVIKTCEELWCSQSQKSTSKTSVQKLESNDGRKCTFPWRLKISPWDAGVFQPHKQIISSVEFIYSKLWELQLLISVCVCVVGGGGGGVRLPVKGKQGAEELTSGEGNTSALNYQQLQRQREMMFIWNVTPPPTPPQHTHTLREHCRSAFNPFVPSSFNDAAVQKNRIFFFFQE